VDWVETAGMVLGEGVAVGDDWGWGDVGNDCDIGDL